MIKALVVDDNRQPADSLCLLLSLLDVNAHAAYGPRAAIIAVKEEVPDILFLDINMPMVDGYEVLSYFKREPRLANVPIVVVTADDSPETSKRARQRGALDVIVKPATLEAIEKTLHAANMVK